MNDDNAHDKIGRARVFVGTLTSNLGNERHVRVVVHADGRTNVSVDLLLPQEGVTFDEAAFAKLQER